MSEPRHPSPAIVIGLDTMQGLQTARILADRNITVHGITGNARHSNNRTRACRSVRVAPGGGDAIIEELVRLGPTLPDRGVLFPCQDSAVATISANRERLSEWYHVVLPDHSLVMTLMDKVSFHRYAIEHDLPVPETHILENRVDAETAAVTLTYPCAVKPANRSGLWSANTTTKAFKVESAQELLDCYDRVHTWADLLLAQQWIAGGEDRLISVNAYFDRSGEPLATFVARKIRQWPPTTGQSSLGVECRNDTVLACAIKLFCDAGYRGLGYLEMKQDAQSGEHFIVEPNIGRPTGRSAIAEAGGVELLDSMYCDTVGLPLPTARTQSYGDVKWIHLRRDLQSSLHWWRQGDLSISDWYRSIRGAKAYAMWSLRDPVPFFGDLMQTARLALSSSERARRTITIPKPKDQR